MAAIGANTAPLNFIYFSFVSWKPQSMHALLYVAMRYISAM